MHYLSEDPWPLVAVLGAVALGFVVAWKITGDGKYMLRAGIAAGLALLVLGIERIWVTDAERIEAVVTDLARAVRESDADGLLAHFTPEVEVTLEDNSLGTPDPTLVRRELQNVAFHRIAVSNLVAEASTHTKLGKATFGAMIVGTYSSPMTRQSFGDRTEWDLGFEETEPGVWKVTRITPMRLHPMARITLQGAMKFRQLFGPGNRGRGR